MQKIQVKIRGTRAILFHNGALVDPRNPFARELKKIHAKRPKTDSDQDEIARLEYLGAFYLDDKGKIVIPDLNLMAAIVEGAAKYRKRKDAKEGVLFNGHGVFDFPHKGDKSPDALWKSGKFVDRRPVKVQRNSIIRSRPRFNEWSCAFELEFDEAICNADGVRQWLDRAGRSALGDYRPMFGQFEVVEFKSEK